MLDCTNNNLSLEQILGAILASDALGQCALRFIPVADGQAEWKDCDAANQDVDQLIKRLIRMDGNGNLGIGVIEVTEPPAGSNCIDCDQTNRSAKEIVVNSVIGLAADGHPALRIATL